MKRGVRGVAGEGCRNLQLIEDLDPKQGRDPNRESCLMSHDWTSTITREKEEEGYRQTEAPDTRAIACGYK